MCLALRPVRLEPDGHAAELLEHVHTRERFLPRGRLGLGDRALARSPSDAGEAGNDGRGRRWRLGSRLGRLRASASSLLLLLLLFLIRRRLAAGFPEGFPEAFAEAFKEGFQ